MKNNTHLNDLIQLVDEAMGGEFADELAAALNTQLVEANAQARIDRANEALDELSWVYHDPTGQDAECPEMDQAIHDKLAAEDHYIRDTDPDRYAEMKYMYGSEMY